MAWRTFKGYRASCLWVIFNSISLKELISRTQRLTTSSPGQDGNWRKSIYLMTRPYLDTFGLNKRGPCGSIDSYFLNQNMVKKRKQYIWGISLIPLSLLLYLFIHFLFSIHSSLPSSPSFLPSFPSFFLCLWGTFLKFPWIMSDLKLGPTGVSNND